MTNLYCIAGKQIAVNSLHSDTHKLCSEYRSEGKADFSVDITQEDIDYERECSAAVHKRRSVTNHRFSDGYFETLAIYRKIAEKMPDYDTVLLHGSAIAVDGNCYIFTAKSGTGKSTHARLWREMLGDRAVMVNDDKPLIHIADSEVTVYGTPWDGKHRLSSNIKVPLKAICFLTRSNENIICRITESEAYPLLLRQVYRPENEISLEKTLQIIDKLIQSVPTYRLGCNMKPESAEIAYNAMKG